MICIKSGGGLSTIKFMSKVSSAGPPMNVFIKLTSAVAPRSVVYINVANIVSLADQTGGAAVRLVGGTTLAVVERAEVILGRAEEATDRADQRT